MVTPAASPGAVTDWKKMKVQELRDELTSRGLDSTGLKPVLIERLEAAAAAKEEGEDIIANDGGRKDMGLNINEATPLGQKVEKQVTEGLTETEPLVAELGKVAETPPVPDELPPVDQVAEDSAAPAVSSITVPNGNNAGPSTDLEKKQRRAERFGLELMVSEGEKRRLRAARFGDTVESKTDGAAKVSSSEDASKLSPTLKHSEALKRKSRAARFGIEEVCDKPAPSTPGTDDSKKKARLARFGVQIKLDPQEQEKKKLRAARFGLAMEPTSDVESKTKVAVEQSVAT